MARTPFKNYSYLMAIGTFLLGVLLLFLTDITTKVIGVVVGFSCLASGACSLYNYFKRDGAKLFELSIFFAGIYFLLGLLLIFYPYRAMSFLMICMGIYLIIKGLLKVNYGLWFKKGNEDCWLVTLATGILYVIIGILVMFNPFKAGFTLNQIVGAFMMITGVLDFQNTFMFKKRTNEIMDIFW